MVQKVKEFIEDNIEYIRDKNWQPLLFNWWILNADYYWDDLVTVLEAIYKDFLEDSLKVRQRCFIGFAATIIGRSKPKQNSISRSSILNQMQSVFGIEDVVEAYPLVDKAAESEGAQLYDGNRYMLN